MACEDSHPPPQCHLPQVEAAKICVLGAGAFGTAMAVEAARNGHDVVIYARDQAQVAHINEHHRNPKALQDFDLPANLRATADLAAALSDAAIVIHALPAQLTPRFLAEHSKLLRPEVPLVITSKGLYLPTQQLIGEAIRDSLGREQALAYLSGPSFAKEMMMRQPTAVVVACENLSTAEVVQRLLSSLDFRVYTSTDVVGVQLGGALKNPLAIGAGLIEGLGYGINTMAFYVTKAQLELQKLCAVMGGDPATISGLSGVGDLMLTAFGDLSRNRSTGIRLAKGESLASIMESMTVEGIPTAAVAVHYADKHGLELPLFRTVAGILDGSLPMCDGYMALMGRPLRHEKAVK